MSNRHPLPALSLVMPHPQLPTLTRIYSPRTPRACTPSTPHLFSKQLIASPRTSIDSWGSSTGGPEDDVQWEWKSEQVSLLVRTLDALPGHLYTPFNGPVPPSNLLDKIARSVSQTQGPLEWPHSVRATRAKLVEIARTQGKENMSMNMTIDEADEEEQPVSSHQVLHYQPSKRAATRKRPLYRQSSMDFLPSKDTTSGSLSRLSSRLQRTDRVIPSYHPYARPASRSPSPPACVEHTHNMHNNAAYSPILGQPQSRNFPTFRPRPLSRAPSTASLTAPAPVLRRTASTASNPLEVENTERTSVPLRRVGSFSIAAHPGTLKRAPSFGSVKSVNKQMSKSGTGAGAGAEKSVVESKTAPVPAEKIPQDLETDDEEKARQVKAKRPRTRSRSGTTAGAPERKKRGDEKEKERDKGKGKDASKVSSGSKPPSLSLSKPVTRSSSKPSSTRLSSGSAPASGSASNCSSTSESNSGSSSTHSQSGSRSKSSSPIAKASTTSPVSVFSPSKPKPKPKPKSSSSSSATNPTASSAAKQTSKINLNSRSSSNCLFGAELPHLSTKPTPYAVSSEPFALYAPFATDILPSADASVSASPPKTLRRVRTTAFPSCVMDMDMGIGMGMGMARRISFGSLVDPEGLETGSKSGSLREGEGLLGAFEIV
ncbi:hypothetical protein BU17DRAFT_62318 [Hysterangium stoloniferum]|nr:hypothetical protein BU17DRAFT_62318 [Hysterangium stoloniferum]